MAVDYQVLAFQDVAPLTKVGIYSSQPLSLDIRGRDFSGVSSVLINGVASPEYMVLSPKRLLAEVPKSQRDARMRAVRVLLSRRGLTPTTSLSFRAIVPGARAEGFTRLLQAFLRLLLTQPGEDFYDSTLGGGLYGIVGSAGTPGELKAAAAQSVSATEAQLRRVQALNPDLADSERLRSATLLQAEYVPSTTSLNLRISLTAVDGTTGSPLVSV